MTRKFDFTLGKEEIAIDVKLQDFFNLPADMQRELFESGKYDVGLSVNKQNFIDFFNYLIDSSRVLQPNSENALDYKDLCEKFKMSTDFILDDILDLSYLYKFKEQGTDKSRYEEKISANLDYYLENYEDDMLKLPISSLIRIFEHKNRQLKDEERAYQFIVKGNSPSFYVLFGSLSFKKLSPESRIESLQKVDERCGFIPKFDYLELEERENLFYKLYISNIKNRLNEISNPSDEDKIRWAMELIQNAKDSLYISTESYSKKKVQITFDIVLHSDNPDYDHVIFTHDGPPFTMNSYYGLIYKISEGKNKAQTTGKFGTGFLTTHVLSKTVKISGDRIERDNETKGFSITMIREGKENKEIKKDIHEMLKSFQKYNQPFNLTKFEYPIKNELSLKCVELGLIHFKKHIYNVLINCPDIEFITLKENEFEIKFQVQKVFPIDQYISLYEVSGKGELKKFIVIKDNSNGISISIEYSDDKKIVPKEKDQESLYTVFPLVGSSAHILPFSINCHDFEPTTERNALILDGEEIINDEETKTCKNRKILLNSIDLFEKMVNYLNENQYSDLHELTVGLILYEKPYNTFDMIWYKEQFLVKLRKVLSSRVTVKTINDESIILDDVYIPERKMYDEFIPKFIDLSVTRKYYPNMIRTAECLIWRKRLWDTFQYVSIENVIEKVKNDDSILTEEGLSSLNEFISFIYKCNKVLLEKYALIPDMNNNFHRMNESNFKRSNTVNDTIINMMEDISIPWKSTHMNKDIHEEIFCNEIKEDKISDAEMSIIDKIKQEKQLSTKLMKYVLLNDKNRENMFYFVTKVGIENSSQITIDRIDPSIWKLADDYVLRKIVDIIEQTKGSIIDNIIEFSLKFIPVFENHFIREKEYIKSARIIPSAKNNLKCLNELFNKSDIFHNHLNSLIKTYFNDDFDDRIIHPIINTLIKSEKNERIIDMLEKINDDISELSEQDQLIIAQKVISIVPNNVNSVSSLIDQNAIFDYYVKLSHTNLPKITIDDKLFSVKHWSISNDIIIKEMSRIIERTHCLNEFQTQFKLNEVESFDILNFLYKYSYIIENNDHPIVPNRDGEFKLKNDLTTNPGIDNEFYQLLSCLDQKTTIHKGIAHIKVKIDSLRKFNVQKFFQTLNDTMNQTLKDKDDPAKVDAINKFLSFDVNRFSSLSEKGMNEKMDLLHNTHISFIHNRIREISSPSKFDYQRWPFELIQNATDCIQKKDNQISNLNGTIMFEFYENQVIFTHYGAPFSNENLISLIYQYGGGKEGTKSIGRFGTGFLTTLVLAKIAHISGDLETAENGSRIRKGFEITIDRSGETREELKQGIKNMEDTKKMDLKPKNETKFVFDVYSNDAYDEGYESLKENIPQTLIFNQSIKSIILKTKNETLTYSRITDNNKDIRKVQIKSTNNNTNTKSFLYSEIKDKFGYDFKSRIITKDIKINCIIELGEKNDIVCNDEFLYLSFPMFGSKPFISPIIINSLDFEPQKERNDIIIQLDEKHKDSYETAINKFIISKSVEVFKNLIRIAIDKKCTNLFNFSNGLNNDSENKFFQDNFVLKMREVFQVFPMFETSNGFLNYEKILIPFMDEYDDFLGENKKDKNVRNEKEMQIYEKYYKIVSNLSFEQYHDDLITSGKYLVTFEQSKGWIKFLWKDFKPKLSIENFLKFFQCHSNIEKLIYVGSESKISLVKDIILFLKESKKFDYYSKTFRFFLNMDGDFYEISDLYYIDSLDKELVQLMDDVKYNYSNDTIHPEIKKFCLENYIHFKSFSIKKAIDAIKNRINDTNYIFLMKYITSDEKRKIMYNISKKYIRDDLEQIHLSILCCKRDLDEMFSIADNIAYIKIIEQISKSNIQNDMEFIRQFIHIIKNHMPNYESQNIFPNQLYQLHPLNELKKDYIRDDNIKETIKNLLHKDLKQFLIEDSLKSERVMPYEFKDLFDEIKAFFKKQNQVLNELDTIKVCSIVLSNSSISLKDPIKEIIELVNILYHENLQIDENKNIHIDSELNTLIKNALVHTITSKISKYSNINEINLPAEIFTKLSTLYCHLPDFKNSGKIYPNNKGELMEFSNIKIIYENGVNVDLLYQLFDFLIKFDPSENTNSFLHKSIEISNDFFKKIRYNNKIIDLKKIKEKILRFPIYDYYKEEIDESAPDSQKRKTQKANAENFIKFIKDNTEVQYVFSKLLTDIDKTLPSDIFDKRDYYVDLVNTQKLLTQFEKRIQIAPIIDRSSYKNSPLKIHFMKAIIFEELNNSNLFINLKINSLSQSNTSLSQNSVQYNNKIFYIDNNMYNHDIYAEDKHKNKFYFVVKTEEGFQLNPKESLFQVKLMSSKKEFFVIILFDFSNNASIVWRGK
ncbi:hypothetical protein M9Y10_039198 [Tritrichomonas musculus]|uniref:Uncharacterized protein n=1 Tax=Tritrichomonas musculus TaxID=1915356 RepID=A0ABR2KB56_9EUKA